MAIPHDETHDAGDVTLRHGDEQVSGAAGRPASAQLRGATTPFDEVLGMGTLTDQPADRLAPPAELEFHPAADLFPLLPVDSPEFGELVADIGEHGLLQPIVLHEGKILDGRNRYRACRHGGIEPRFVEWSGDSPTAYVLSLNLKRRHLTDDQRAAVVQKARASLDAEARERKAAAGRKSAPGRPAEKDVADSPHLSRRAPTTRQRLAELADVSEHKMRQTEHVHKADPELLDQIHAGKVQLRGAVKEIERREPAATIKAPRKHDHETDPGAAEPEIPEGEDPAETTAPIDLPPVTTPVERWTAEEREKQAQLEQGMAAAVNLRSHRNLIAWAQHNGLFVRVDRATPWGNPFELGKDGDRATVIANYRDHYLPFKPSLIARLDELRGKALGCWCAPEPCHADVLIGELERDKASYSRPPTTTPGSDPSTASTS